MKAEELSPKDLRIGNFVNYKYFNPHPENTEYCFTKVVIKGVYESSIMISFPKQKHIEKVSKVYSIPLSQEVLLKCGYSESNFESGEILLVEGGVFIITHLIEKKVIRHLHQLQNIYYALTGKELDVSL